MFSYRFIPNCLIKSQGMAIELVESETRGKVRLVFRRTHIEDKLHKWETICKLMRAPNCQRLMFKHFYLPSF